jgi:SH3-like domain-containing protein
MWKISGMWQRLGRHMPSWLTVGAAIILLVPLAAQAQAPAENPGDAPAPAVRAQTSGPLPSGKGPSGFPLPRFVSLKSDRVNLRAGPGTDYPASWVFRRAGLPLEVIKEFETWRQVRDAEGTNGWVLQSFLSGRRTALVLPWDVKEGSEPPQVPIMNSDSSSSRTVAVVEAGVIANVLTCDSVWCSVTVEKYRGYIEQKKLWGVYDGEILK